jgi:hypothetical protein
MPSIATKTEYIITLNNKKYSCALTKVNDQTTHIFCPTAWIDQDFLNEDVPQLLIDLPKLILDNIKEKDSNVSTTIHIRLLKSEKNKIQKNALAKGYKSVSSYVRDMAIATKY